MERVILGDGIKQAIQNVTLTLKAGTGNKDDAFFAHALAKMAEWAPRPPVDVTLEIGQGCDWPFHVFTATQLMLHSNETELKTQAGYVSAVRETILLGGENANRGTFIAAIVAAAIGDVDAAVPVAWMPKVIAIQEIVQLAHALASGGHGNAVRSGDRGSKLPKAAKETSINIAHRIGKSNRSAQQRSHSQQDSDDSYRWHHDEQEILRNSPGCVANSNHTTSNATRPPSHPDDIAGLRALYLATNGQVKRSDGCRRIALPASALSLALAPVVAPACFCSLCWRAYKRCVL